MLLKQRLYQFDNEIVNIVGFAEIKPEKIAVIYIAMTDDDQVLKVKALDAFEERAIEINFEKIKTLLTNEIIQVPN